MRGLSILTLALLPAVTAAQKSPVPHLAETTKMDALQLHQWAISRTVQVVAGPDAAIAPLGSGGWVSAEGYVATCWHVVENANLVTIRVAFPGVYDLERNVVENANFKEFPATVVASDKNADVAILKVSPNPFSTPGATQPLVKGGPPLKMAPAHLHSLLPAPGDLALLAGYPLGRPDLIIQPGSVAAVALVDEFQGPEVIKAVRIILALVSNPANSGGPVFNAEGELLGLLRANFPSPVKDKDVPQDYAKYFRPKRNPDGTYVLDAGGHIQPEITYMYQNSGLSIVVPSYFIREALAHAQGKAIKSQNKSPLSIEGNEVMITKPDLDPKPASSLSGTELKRQTDSFLIAFRNFLTQQNARRDLLSGQSPPATATKEERDAAWERISQQSTALNQEMTQHYQAAYKTDAKRLRDLCWARLPTEARDIRSVHIYDYPHDSADLFQVAEDLDRLSKMIPGQ